jgi:hypothetical protein
MRNLVQQFQRNVETAGSNPPYLVHTAKHVGSADEIRPPRPDERGSGTASREWLSAEVLTLVLATAVALVFMSSFYLFRGTYVHREPIEKSGVKALVERIIAIESNGDPNAKTKRSSATGSGQFLEETWHEAIRKHRRDLIQGRSYKEVLELRRDADLAREIITRVLEQYAIMLNKRGLPVTPGSLYLTYFAGPAGAVALLSGAENADAASLMASADVTGRTTRDKLVRANPFLKVLTVADLKSWADHKMRGD